MITANVGTASNTLAAGNDTRITGALQQTAYSADIANVLDTNCGVSSTPKWNVSTDMWTCVAIGSLAASAISSGTIASARLGSGTADATTFLRGDGTRRTVERVVIQLVVRSRSLAEMPWAPEKPATLIFLRVVIRIRIS